LDKLKFQDNFFEVVEQWNVEQQDGQLSPILADAAR
jgi:hypothetical protein